MAIKNSNSPEDGAFWSITSYLITGLGVWGGTGYGLDHHFHTKFFTLLGLLLGAGSAYYLIWMRFVRVDPKDQAK